MPDPHIPNNLDRGVRRSGGIRFGLRGGARAAQQPFVRKDGGQKRAGQAWPRAGRPPVPVRDDSRSARVCCSDSFCTGSEELLSARVHRDRFGEGRACEVQKAFCLLSPPPTSCYVTSSCKWAHFRTAEPPAELNRASSFVVLENLSGSFCRNVNSS